MNKDASSKPSGRGYEADDIKTLDSLEHIQARPGMYIGRLGNGEHPDDGIYVLLKEVIDNSVDEFTNGFGKRIDIQIEDERRAVVRDYGRGIPLPKVVDCVSKINTGAKFATGEDGKPRPFAYSIGLNGVGLKAVNALSDEFTVTSRREGRFVRAVFAYGCLVDQEEGKTDEVSGTEVRFTPSPKHFSDFRFDLKYLNRRLWNYAYLNSGLSLYLNNERFYSRHGLLDLLNEKVEQEALYDIVYHKSNGLEFAFCHTPAFGETYYSFVNGQYTNDGGTHQSAFREGILKGINEIAEANQNLDPSDVRNGIVGAVAVKINDPIFESQTKSKLSNTDIRPEIVNEVKRVVLDHLFKHPDTKDRVFEKIGQNAKVRKQIQTVKKQAKEQAKKTSFKIPKLRDCKFHLNESSDRRKEEDRARCAQSMIFLTEGDSAAGSMISCRDVDTQAIFSLRGKPLNCYGHRLATVYKNEELYFIMQALGIEDGLDNLRYGKVVIATDADVDGLHIRNLLITYFLTFFEQLILSDHLYILETPLFRVRTKQETIYCYDERERDEARRKLGKGVEVTRFKGLGEISPNEFGQFIGEEIRLIKVTVDNLHGVGGVLDFFMGKNTPDRKEYIMQNLVQDA
jgi:DNA gyrase/topoisomerase IV subunit B